MGKRPVALKMLQQTPTDPAEAGNDNRLCQKCGLWVEPEQVESLSLTPTCDIISVMKWMGYLGSKPPAIVFLGEFNQQDREYLLSITRKKGLKDESIVFRGETICPTSVEDRHHRDYPTQLRCCRAFLLGWLGHTRPDVVMAMGDSGLAALTGNASMRVTHQFGREITIPEIPEQVAFATYHPSETRRWQKAARSIQNNFQLVRDVQRTQEEMLKKPSYWKDFDDLNTFGECGFDSEFDDNQVWTVSLAVPEGYVVKDSEEK